MTKRHAMKAKMFGMNALRKPNNRITVMATNNGNFRPKLSER